MARFVDRDMFMRFLGYRIGHKEQTKCVEHFNEAENEDYPEDTLDLQNMTRIAQTKIVRPVSETNGNMPGDHDNPLAEECDAVSDIDENDLNRNF